MLTPLQMVHVFLSDISHDAVVVDATMGQGYDTVFLAKLSDHVYAFDLPAKDVLQQRPDPPRLPHDHGEHIVVHQRLFPQRFETTHAHRPLPLGNILSFTYSIRQKDEDIKVFIFNLISLLTGRTKLNSVSVPPATLPLPPGSRDSSHCGSYGTGLNRLLRNR